MKTSELTREALNWAVAICQNVECDENNKPIWFDNDGSFASRSEYTPSADWAQGGLIIEREGIEITRGGAYAEHFWKATGSSRAAYGPTPLIAGMRCYVASKLGDEVEIPEQL